MAIEFVGRKSAIRSASTSGTASLTLSSGLTGGTRSSVQAGDYVIAVYSVASNADRTLSITDGTFSYVVLGSELYANGTVDANLRVAGKIMGDTPDSQTVFGATGSTSDQGFIEVLVFSGVDPSKPLDVAVVTATGLSTGQPNPAAITPVTAGAMIVAVGAAAANSPIGSTFTSSNLSNFSSSNPGDAAARVALNGSGTSAWVSGAFDPAQFGGGSVSAGASWAAVTIALRPTTGAPPPFAVGYKKFTTMATSAQSVDLSGFTDVVGTIGSLQADDYVLIWYSHYSNTTRSLAQCVPAGYTPAHAASITASDTAITSGAASYKKQGATPDANVSIPPTNSTSSAASAYIIVVRGADPTTFLDVVTTTASGTNGGRPNPPSITPSTAGALVVGLGGASSNITEAVFDHAGDYNQFVSTQTTVGIRPGAEAMGLKTDWASGAFDAGAWTGGNTDLTSSWVAATLAIRPAPVSTPSPTYSSAFFAFF